MNFEQQDTSLDTNYLKIKKWKIAIAELINNNTKV